MARDPVCGMAVDEKSTRYKTETNGKAYYFCSPGCLAEFRADPTKFLK